MSHPHAAEVDVHAGRELVNLPSVRVEFAAVGGSAHADRTEGSQGRVPILSGRQHCTGPSEATSCLSECRPLDPSDRAGLMQIKAELSKACW